MWTERTLEPVQHLSISNLSALSAKRFQFGIHHVKCVSVCAQVHWLHFEQNVVSPIQALRSIFFFVCFIVFVGRNCKSILHACVVCYQINFVNLLKKNFNVIHVSTSICFFVFSVAWDCVLCCNLLNVKVYDFE